MTRDGFRPSFFAGTNPGGIGHDWVKKLFVDQDAEFLRDAEIDPEQVQFIPALVTDNPALMARDPGYLKRLEALPEEERKALRYGDWDVFIGQFFKAWRRSLHVCAGFEIPPDWKRYRAIDYGGSAPWVCLWFAVDPSCSPKRIYVYREYSAAGSTLGHNVREVLRLSEGERYETTWADPSMWNRTQDEANARISLADQCSRLGLKLTRGYNDRDAGWTLMKEALEPAPDGLPSLIYFWTCRECVSSIPSLVHDDKRVEDLDTDGNDHCADASRYGVCGIMGVKAKAKPRAGASRRGIVAGSRYGGLE